MDLRRSHASCRRRLNSGVGRISKVSLSLNAVFDFWSEPCGVTFLQSSIRGLQVCGGLLLSSAVFDRYQSDSGRIEIQKL